MAAPFSIGKLSLVFASSSRASKVGGLRATFPELLPIGRSDTFTTGVDAAAVGVAPTADGSPIFVPDATDASPLTAGVEYS